MSVPKGAAKDSMKSTWRRDRSQWTIDHWLFYMFNLFHYDLDKPIPVHAKTDKVPYLTTWSQHLFIITHALWPVGYQYLVKHYTGRDLSPYSAFGLYLVAFVLNSGNQINCMRVLGHRYGYLDGDKHQRDEVPDVGVSKAMNALTLTISVRPLFMVLLAYKRNELPSFSWLLPVELCLYSIILDFFFYFYHRACHEVDWLWRFHRTHHLTKHPNAMLSAYADSEQELIEIAILPVMTWASLKLLGFEMGFYDWWICHQYIIFAESWGHSGLRLYAVSAGASGHLLRSVGCDLVTEDHDLHHRNGWRKSYNYGKQTRLWDVLFGTCGPRLETMISNVDFSQKVNMPIC